MSAEEFVEKVLVNQLDAKHIVVGRDFRFGYACTGDYHLLETLSKVYEAQKGEKAELIAIGGGTYARSLEAGVAFGPLFPGREDIAHQKDEYMFIEDLLKATALYAEAIYELAK